MSDRSLPDYDPLTEIMLEIFRLNGRLLQTGDDMVAPLGLSSARWQVLGALALAAKSIAIPQVAELMGITRQGTLKQLNRLEDEGFVAQVPNPRHERSPLYCLTAKGQKAYREAERLQAIWSSTIAEGLPAKNLELTLKTLRTIYERLALPVPKKENQS
jgi:DNA-binding MarR family transcriptional regulator